MAKRIIRETETIRDDFDERPYVNGRDTRPAREMPLEETGLDKVRSVRQSLGADKGLQVKIYKITDSGEEDFCYQTEGEINEPYIQKRFKGGRYVAKTFVNGMYQDRIPFGIAQPADEADVATSRGPNSLAEIQVRLLEQQLSFYQQLLLKGNGAERTPITELVHAVSELKALQGPESNIDSVLKYIELGRTLNGGAEESNPVMELLKAIAPAVAPQILGGLMKAKETAPNGGMADHSTALPVKTASDPANPQASEAQLMNLKASLAYLKTKAIRGSDPEDYISWLLDNDEMADVQFLLSKIASESFEYFVGLDPEIGKEPYETFFRKLYDGLGSVIKQTNSVERNPAGASGNTGNAPGDAKSRKGGGRAS